MAQGVANKVRIGYKLEASFGTTPGGNGTLLRCTDNAGLNYNLATETSKEVRSDRQISDVILVGADSNGPVPFELSYREYDPFFEAALQGTWQAWGTNGVGAVIPTSATFAANTLTAGATTSGSSIFTSLALGQWVRISGSTNPLQNILVQVSKTVAPTTTVLTFEGTPFTGATGSGGAAVKVNTSRLSNGTTERTFSLERGHTDINQFFLYRGMMVDKLSLSLKSKSVITGQLDFVGKDAIRNGSTQMGTPAASQTYDVMNAVAGIGTIQEGGSAISGTALTDFTINLSNNTRARAALGTMGAYSLGSGTLMVEGSMTVYLSDGTLYDKFINQSNSSVVVPMYDAAGNGYVFTVPNMKYKDAKVTGGSLDTDCMLEIPYQAFYDPTTGKTLIIDRFGNGV